MTLALAALALAQPPQMVKQVDVDYFNTPYTVNVSGPMGDVHEWPGLNRKQCMFYRRATRLTVNSNPNGTVLTFDLGQGSMAFSSPKQIFWHFNLDYFTQDGTFVNLSNVNRFYVDCSHVPDIAAMYVYDKWHNSGGASSIGQIKGIYFKKASFGGAVDWKSIYNISFRLDFNSTPNPLQVEYSKIYVTLEPGLFGPGSQVVPLSMGG